MLNSGGMEKLLQGACCEQTNSKYGRVDLGRRQNLLALQTLNEMFHPAKVHSAYYFKKDIARQIFLPKFTLSATHISHPSISTNNKHEHSSEPKIHAGKFQESSCVQLQMRREIKSCLIHSYDLIAQPIIYNIKIATIIIKL